MKQLEHHHHTTETCENATVATNVPQPLSRLKNIPKLQCNECIDAVQKLKKIQTKIFNDIITDKVKHIIK
jgi:hypothetical protein